MRRVLVTDDELPALILLRDLLIMEGFQVFEAHDGIECLEKAHAERPDFILLDVNMPRMDGMETCRRLKADPATKDIPVIYITAYTQAKDIKEGLALGAAGYLEKPVNFQKLFAILNQLGGKPK